MGRCDFIETGMRPMGKWGKERGTEITRGCTLELTSFTTWLFDSIGHLQRDCTNVLQLEVICEGRKGRRKYIYRLLLPSYSCVSLSKSIQWIFTPNHFQVLSPDYQAGYGEAKISVANLARGKAQWSQALRHEALRSTVESLSTTLQWYECHEPLPRLFWSGDIARVEP